MVIHNAFQMFLLSCNDVMLRHEKKQAGKKVGTSLIPGVHIMDDDCVFFFVRKKKHAGYILAYACCLGLQSLLTYYAIMQITEMANLLLNHP